MALEALVKRDPTLNDLFQLDYGWQAWRVAQVADWQKEEYESEEGEEAD